MKLQAIVILATVVLTAACQPQQKARTGYQVTPIPFDIDKLTEDQRRVIRQGHETDSSLNLVRTRPVLFQIVGTGDNANETRGPGRIGRDVDVLIFGLGEASGDGLVDYGWLENVRTDAIVWEMTRQNTVYAGGDAVNRKRVSRLTLPPGDYRLRYVSNASHAFTGWQGAAPEHGHLYGITVFNMTALPGIEKRLKEAGVPALGTSLERPHDQP